MSFRSRPACALTMGLTATLTAILAAILAVTPAAIPAAALTVTTPAATPYERVLNGTFDGGSKEPWWSSETTPSRAEGGRLCADVPAGTANPWDSMIGQNDIPLENGQPYKLTFTAVATRSVTIKAIAQMSGPPYTTPIAGEAQVGTSPRAFEITGTSTIAETKSQIAFQMGGAAEAYTLCLDDISFTGGVIPPGGVRDLGSPVRVNQVGYLPGGPKRATIVTPGTRPLTWRLLDASGRAAATGTTRVFGADAMSGDHVHTADFTRYRTRGTFRLAVGADVSEPFEISESLYGRLRTDALAYFYHNRSGIPIEAKYAGAAYARPAGHAGVAPNRGDLDVPCAPGACDYRMDVRGGWYDAGDHGKYVVNGALAAWQLIDAYEQAGDVRLAIPETGGGMPDVLDEARWELDFLLRMQRPDGMVHHKIHDAAWTGLPLRPEADPQARLLFPVSTAATLNLAAAGARCHRVYRRFDRAFAARCLAAATKAWAAAHRNPALYAPAESVGGGPYDDTKVSDEFSWAAAELFAATGRRSYLKEVTTGLTAENFSWKETGGLADLALVRVRGRLDVVSRLRLAARLVKVADGHLADLRAQGYANPFLPADGRYVWGSSSATANTALVLAYAHELTRLPKYREGALESLDYLLGRNALNQSYVTGYGERASKNQHHRFWAHQLDPALPYPAPGSLAGGPNSGLQDPVAQRNLRGCAPATCYIDDIGSYATNEVAVNWNSALAWLTAYADTTT
ncbi:glycoside hydrolase family 9 protein [Nonomuraea typhae]|uniref:glycoside hydrolase family 9 protein n=1 Tax=Nonomuraea typhae TaxID=2603600 RepID=UPI001FEC146F|nr:glycoside hydrolase family 9 protein [Nonomuraea typhae]